jgi:hypothetical protein
LSFSGTSPGAAQCGYGCSENAGEEISAMVDYDDGMRLFTVGGGSSPVPMHVPFLISSRIFEKKNPLACL